MRVHLVCVAVLGVEQRRVLQAVAGLADPGGAHDGGDGEAAVAPVASLGAARLLVTCNGSEQGGGEGSRVHDTAVPDLT